MARTFARIVVLLLAAGSAGGALTSAVALQPVRAVQLAPTAIRIIWSADSEATPLRLRFRPDPTPSPSAAPTPSPTISRAAPAALPPHSAPPVPLPPVQAQEIALVNLDSGHFLWQSNTRAPWAPASLTKIFTAMVAVDLMGLDRVVTVPSSIMALPADSTLMGLTPGEQVSVRQLLYGVFLNSANDAAEALATAVTSRATFIADMNAKAARLGLRTTHFMNPTGLDEPAHYSSAYDLAIASMYLESHYGSLVAIAATPAITIPASATHKAFNLVSLDKLLWTYPGTYGLKTGWTDAALGCLITTSSRGGHRLLAVMLGAPAGTAYAQMPKILDYGFEVLGVLPRPAA